jgi:hypothetical protein
LFIGYHSTRLENSVGFAKQKIELRDGRVFEFPEVTDEDVKQIGYLTFRVEVD